MKEHKARVLIADDDPDILEILSFNLIKEDYEVFKAVNGKEALELAIQQNPDLIVLDVMMPYMDGVETCREIRKVETLEKSLVIFLTAMSDEESEITGLDSGADDYIVKPIKPKLFLKKIKSILRRKGLSEEVMTFQDLVIDQERFIVTYKGNEISLPKKEFELMVLLASRPGVVFKRQEILNKVWGSDVIVGDRTIDVHIRKIRKKLGSDFIRTIKGVGYKFEA